MRKNIYDYLDIVKLVDLSRGYRIADFKCEFDDYSTFLCEHALTFQEVEVAKTHLLINKTNGDIIAFMSLFADSIKLSPDEKESHEIEFIPFESIPAIKIGQLAVDARYNQEFRGIGSLMIELARGITEDVRERGVSCRFITVDADTENNPTVVEYYLKNSFKLNEKYKKKSKVSMRLDLFGDISKKEIYPEDIEE